MAWIGTGLGALGLGLWALEKAIQMALWAQRAVTVEMRDRHTMRIALLVGVGIGLTWSSGFFIHKGLAW